MPDTAEFRTVHNLPMKGCLAHMGVSGVCSCKSCTRNPAPAEKESKPMAANKIEITRSKTDTRVLVDGVEIPSHAILNDGIDVPVDNDDAPRVRLELVARTVNVHNTVEDGS